MANWPTTSLGCDKMLRATEFLIDNFKTPSELISFLQAYGVEAPNPPTVSKWFQRDAIPGSWLPILLAYLEIDNGSPVSIKRYVGGSV